MSSRRHPLLKGRPKGVWYPDLVGKVPGYPKTIEKFEEKQVLCRRIASEAREKGTLTMLGRTHGWAGPRRTKLLLACKAKARSEAKEIIVEMKAQGMLEDVVDPRAEEVLVGLIEMVTAKDDNNKMQYAYTAMTRIAAGKVFLQYTKPTPTQRSAVKVDLSAEDYLGSLLASSRSKSE